MRILIENSNINVINIHTTVFISYKYKIMVENDIKKIKDIQVIWNYI
jgi:hypothetical protein